MASKDECFRMVEGFRFMYPYHPVTFMVESSLFCVMCKEVLKYDEQKAHESTMRHMRNFVTVHRDGMSMDFQREVKRKWDEICATYDHRQGW